MKVCPNCQRENAADNVFCDQCGQDLSTVAVTDTAGTSHRRSDGRSQHLRLSKWAVISGVVVLGLIILTIGFSIYQTQVVKPRKVAAIVKKVTDDQPNQFATELVSDDPSVTITAKTVKPFMTYTRKHPQYVRDMAVDLKHDGYTSDKTFRVVTAGHAWLIFPVYKLQVTMMHPEIETNVNNATIKANGTVLTTTKSKHATYKAGPLFPGSYQFKLISTQSTVSEKANLTSAGDTHRTIALLAKKTSKAKDVTVDSAKNDTAPDAGPSANDANDSSATQTGKSYDDLSGPAQTAVAAIADAEDIDPDDFTFTESEPNPDVYEIKLYAAGEDTSANTFRYDNIHSILAELNRSTGKFEQIN
ncbi:hypothetical protein N692_04765 [Lactiplantibacillus plantarum EGD-AQ4]|nr:hypothetical protein N692_04765 [Lactiplantibacillus plantarum EGD-AQ4]